MNQEVISKVQLNIENICSKNTKKQFLGVLYYMTDIFHKKDAGPRPQKVTDESVSQEGSYLASLNISILVVHTTVNNQSSFGNIN